MVLTRRAIQTIHLLRIPTVPTNITRFALVAARHVELASRTIRTYRRPHRSELPIVTFNAFGSVVLRTVLANRARNTTNERAWPDASEHGPDKHRCTHKESTTTNTREEHRVHIAACNACEESQPVTDEKHW